MVDNEPRAPETLREIADRHHRAYDTLRNQWSRHPAWPAPIGRRSRSYVYDPAAVDQVIAEHFERPAIDLDPGKLYTARQIADAAGITAGTIRADVTKGRWPAADDTTGPAHRWYGSTATTALEARRAYHRE